MEIISPILSNMPEVGTCQSTFLETLFPAIFATRGPVNFRNLSRYSELTEKTYRRQFAKPCDFVRFNRRLIDRTIGTESERIGAFDASFIKKAGKSTYGLGFFYNGCNHRPEKGLEISSLAIVDVTYQTALTLSVRQSEARAEKRGQFDEETMIDQYMDHIRHVHPSLHARETTLVFDGAFAKIKVFDVLGQLGLTGITRLRKDADMRYFYEGPKRASGSGRQKVYDGKVNWTELSRFECVGVHNGYKVYTKVLNHKQFNRTLRTVVLVDPHDPEDDVILACTDEAQHALTICHYYSARFQIEFTYRDAKQYTGLADGQARDEHRLEFHFNASLTALNLAKAEQIQQHESAEPFVFSMASVKARYFNEHYLDLFFLKLGLDPELIKKSPHYQWLCDYGTIAA
ncbi:MAG: transposase [Candidatus Latescibacteria bacterium]|nr:transposase [Candidatus Latescibacterota bacterium]